MKSYINIFFHEKDIEMTSSNSKNMSKKSGGSSTCSGATNVPVSGNSQTRALITPPGIMGWLGGLTNIFSPARSDLVNSSNNRIETPMPSNSNNLPPYKLEETNILKPPKTPSIRVSDKQIPSGEAYLASSNQLPKQLSRGGGKKKTLKKKKLLRLKKKRGKKTRKN